MVFDREAVESTSQRAESSHSIRVRCDKRCFMSPILPEHCTSSFPTVSTARTAYHAQRSVVPISVCRLHTPYFFSTASTQLILSNSPDSKKFFSSRVDRCRAKLAGSSLQNVPYHGARSLLSAIFQHHHSIHLWPIGGGRNF